MNLKDLEKIYFIFGFLIFIIMGSIILSGCASLIEMADPNTFYMRDMKIKANDKKGYGAMILKRAESYQIEIEAKGRLDLFTLQSCHREISREKAGKKGIFGNKKKVQIDYKPSKGIEDTGYCPVLIGGYEKSKGRHSWAFIDFEDPFYSLEANLKCNGNQEVTNGVSVCQSKLGLLQSIEFDSLVAVQHGKGCKPITEKDIGNRFEFSIQKGRCIFEFAEIENPYRTHRLTTLGYEKILIRGDQ